MSCTELGFNDCGTLRLSKSADVQALLPFPSTFDFTGFQGELVIRASEDAVSALLTVSNIATANGSVMAFTDNNITLTIKAADVQLLPDGSPADEPWEGVYEWVLTDTNSLTTRLVAGALVAEKGVVR